MDTCDLRIRVSPGEKAWLEFWAGAEHRSINGELRALLSRAMLANPLTIFVQYNQLWGEDAFSVSLGLETNTIFIGKNREEAIKFALAKCEELGLQSHAIKYGVISSDLEHSEEIEQ